MALDTLTDVDCRLKKQAQGDDIKSFVQTNAANLWQEAIAARPQIEVVVRSDLELPTGARVKLSGDGARAKIQLSGGGKGPKITVAEAILYCVQEVYNVKVAALKDQKRDHYKQIVAAATTQQLSMAEWLLQNAYAYAMAVEHLEFGALQQRQAMAAVCEKKFGHPANWTWESFNKNINHGISFGDYFKSVPMNHTFYYVQNFLTKICGTIADPAKKQAIEETWTKYSKRVSSLKAEAFKETVHDTQVQRWRADNNL